MYHRSFYEELGGRVDPTGSGLETKRASGDEGSSQSQEFVRRIHDSIIGHGSTFLGPYGKRQILYADWTASGRNLSFVEKYLQNQVMPLYGNTHTTTSITGLQSTCFRHEARQIISQSLNCNTKEDVVLFVGSGCTGAINKLVAILGLNHAPTQKDGTTPPESERAVVFVGPHEHHSNILPWRESHADVIHVKENADGAFDVVDLKLKLEKYKGRKLKIGSFTMASNITGIVAPAHEITEMMHRAGGLAFWDCATAGPYMKIDMNPVVPGEGRAFVYKDAVFLSPHKMVGGPGSPGILVVKKRLLSNAVPEQPGGGTVFFVTDRDHRYLANREEREEGGTPNILGSARAGLAFHLKQKVGTALIHKLEERNWKLVTEVLETFPQVHILGSTTVQRLPILSFLIECGGEKRFLHYNYVCALLNDLYGIQSRGGCQCAGPYGQALLSIDYSTAQRFEAACIEKNEYLRPGFSRLSFPYFLAEEEVLYIAHAIGDIATKGWKLLPFYRFNHKTGEWKHRSRITKFVERKWLSHAFDTDSLGNAAVGGSHLPDAKEWMSRAKKEADGLFDAARSNAGKEGLGIDQTHMVESGLRWCVLPSEATDALESKTNLAEEIGSLTSLEEVAGGLYPRQYSRGADTGENRQVRKRKWEEVGGKPESGAGSGTKAHSYSNGKKKKKEKYPLRSASGKRESTGAANLSKAASNAALQSAKNNRATLFPKPPKKIYRSVGQAMAQWKMVQPGDRLLLGLSGGKDSLTLLHVLHNLQKRSPIKFELAAATVDPGTDAFDPSPLIAYMKSLGIPYFYLSEKIMDRAKTEMEGTSICAYCSRMKRGALYSCCRKEGYNVLVLAQHLDDLAESFVMSAFHNGQLRTMKANYTIGAGDIRVIRPFAYTRESQLKKFAYEAKLPVINENCPACFEAPKERQRVKKMLAQQESLIGGMYGNLKQAILPLMDESMHDEMKRIRRKIKQQGLEKIVGNEPGMKNAGKELTLLNRRRKKKKPLPGSLPPGTDASKGFGSTLLEGASMAEKPTSEVLGKSDVVGIYFSANWCPPCRKFTPKLIEAYSELKKAGHGLQIVFVSNCHTAGKFKTYYEEMPWAAVPYNEVDARERLGEKYNVQGLPKLVFVDKHGKMITEQGVQLVSNAEAASTLANVIWPGKHCP